MGTLIHAGLGYISLSIIDCLQSSSTSTSSLTTTLNGSRRMGSTVDVATTSVLVIATVPKSTYRNAESILAIANKCWGKRFQPSSVNARIR